MFVGPGDGGDAMQVSGKALHAKFRRARETGQLSLAGCGLQELPREVQHLDENMGNEEKWWQCVDLSKVDASHNEIAALPTDMSALATLVALKLDHNALRSVPESIAVLHELKLLNVGHNPLKALPAAVGALATLVELDADHCHLSSLPAELADCTMLEVLTVSGNRLRELPDGIGRLSRLLHLHASDNALEALPESLSECALLQTLDVARNRLRRLPSLHRMRGLREVDFRENALTETPALPHTDQLQRLFLGFNKLQEIDGEALSGPAAGLVLLDIRDNALRELPASLARLSSLTTLDVSNNDLGELPPSLGYVKPLRQVLVHGNPMRRIRRTLLTGPTEALKKYLRTRGPPLEAAEALGPGAGAGVADDASAVVAAGAGHALDVEGAKDYFGAAALGAGGVELGVVAREARSSGRIDLAGRGLHTLPTAALAHAHLDECTHSLDVASNALADIDPALADALPSLRALHASNNRIARLPLALAGMARVQVLDLDQNKLTDDSFAPFDQARAPLGQALRVVRLNANALTTLPLCVFACTELEEVHASMNRVGAGVSRLPWHRLSRLHTVDLSNNQLPEVPAALAATASLTSLNVANNEIRRVPAALARLPALRALWLEGNPQREIRPNILAQGTVAVLAALERRAEGVVPDSGPALPDDTEQAPSGWAAPKPQPPAPAPGPEGGAREEQVARASGADAAEREALEVELREVDAQLEDLKAKADDFSLSRAKQHALKKETARVNARRIRVARALGLRR